MKKTLLTLFVFLASAGYVAYEAIGGASSAAVKAQSPTISAASSVQATDAVQAAATQPVATAPANVTNAATTQTNAGNTTDTFATNQTSVQTSAPTQAPAQNPAPVPVTKPAPVPAPVATPAPVPVTKPEGQYADGTYTGSGADAYYGTVQVQAVISGGKLTAVNFLSYPSDRRTSQYINSQAMPMLQTEALQAQSANVSGVSGATDTSQAFIQSLSSALAQAKNS